MTSTLKERAVAVVQLLRFQGWIKDYARGDNELTVAVEIEASYRELVKECIRLLEKRAEEYKAVDGRGEAGGLYDGAQILRRTVGIEDE